MSAIGRRAISIPTIGVLWLAWIALLPVWGTLALVIDLVRRRRFVALRCGVMIAVYLTCEVVGLVLSLALWVARRLGRLDDDAWLDLHFRLEAAWGTALFRSMCFVFGLRVEVEGAGAARLGEGPVLLLVRHSSIADTLLAAALVSRAHGLRLRYVLKRELLVDPCLDVVGHRLPNVFVDRDSDDSQREVRRVRAIAEGLGPRDGVLIYPEGTRCTRAKRERVERRFAERNDAEMIRYLGTLSRHVLPPRTGGTLGLLAAAPTADVVFCRHTGFEGIATVSDVWRGGVVGLHVRVRFDRVDRRDVPDEPDRQRRWLLDEWQLTGRWVDAHRAEAGARPGRPPTASAAQAPPAAARRS